MNEPQKTLSVRLRIWRQPIGNSNGQFVEYGVNDIPVEASFLEMLDILNEQESP